MMKFLIFLFVPYFIYCQDLTGYWQKLDEAGKPQLVVAFYPYFGKYFGRIVAVFDEEGSLKEPSGKALGIKGSPPMHNLDFIWNLKQEGKGFSGGKIINPLNGMIANASAKLEGSRLIVRGSFLFFGKNLIFVPFNYPSMHLDASAFIPKIPEKF